MSQENVELVRAAYAAFNRGDFDAVATALHPEVEWHPYLGGLERTVYRGHDAIRAMWSSIQEGFGGTLRIDLPEVVDCGGQTVVVVIEARGTGSGSGAEVQQGWAQLITVRDGRVFRVAAYADRDAALEAAGSLE